MTGPYLPSDPLKGLAMVRAGLKERGDGIK
jgi:hypothetical protein